MIIYRLQVEDAEGRQVVCDIHDGASSTNEVILLEGAEMPLILRTIDNDEDKFTPIRALQLEISFLSTLAVNLNTFSEGEDNRWYVSCYYSGGETVFLGYLSLADMQEDFLSDPNVVTLTATDGLGLLKDIPLTNTDSVNPKGGYTIATYFRWAQYPTGIGGDFHVLSNLRYGVTPNDHLWNKILDAKTFEDEIGTCVDCYTALERILGEDCFVTQIGGQWWVFRVEEMDIRIKYIATFMHNAEQTGYAVTAPLIKDIGVEEDSFLSEEATYVALDRPLGSVKNTFSYNYPKEIVDNIDFVRGGLNGVLAPTLIEGIDYPSGESTTGYSVDAFHIADWTLYKNLFVAETNAVAVDSVAYIKRIYSYGQELSRYAVIAQAATPGEFALVSNEIPVVQNDKFSFSVDIRRNPDLGGSGEVTEIAARIVLHGNDGFIYMLDNDVSGGNPKWYKSTLNSISVKWNREDDQRIWVTASVEAPPCPVSGRLKIRLISTDATFERHFQNLRFDYKPYINGSYQKYKGHYHKLSQAGNYKSVRKEEVYLSDSPRRLFKGSLIYYNGSSFVHIPFGNNFFDYSIYHTPAVPSTEWKPYGWWQAQSAWNQYKRTMRLMNAQIQGFGGSLPTFRHLYRFTDDSPHTNNKLFMLVHFEMDLQACSWSGLFAETYDSEKPKVYTDSYEFKFMEDRD